MSQNLTANFYTFSDHNDTFQISYYPHAPGPIIQDFHTLAIKTTSYGILPKEGARLTYEVIHLRGKAQHIILPLTAQ